MRDDTATPDAPPHTGESEGTPELSARSRSEEVAEQHPREHRYISLFQRVATVNSVVLVAAVAATIALLAPHRLSSFTIDAEIGVLIAALLLIAAVNLYLLRRVTRPLQALTIFSRTVDLTEPRQRLPDAKPTSEAGQLSCTFNEMLDRLETERRDATGRVLAAQEAERLRIARELHDQIGQELTAVLLLLSRVRSRVGADLRDDVQEVQEAVRASLEDVRQIAVELRPEALDDLGLASALAVLGARLAERAGLEVRQQITERLPRLSPEAELVLYRVAQEALTNVARHSGAEQAELSVGADDEHVTLTVRDYGRGLPADQTAGSGIRGMRERASLIGARLEISSAREGTGAGVGCQVRLVIPISSQRWDA